MHHSLMACQERLSVGAHFLSPHRQITSELMNSTFSGLLFSLRSGGFNFRNKPILRKKGGNLIQKKLILVRANKQAQMSAGLYVHSAQRILDLSGLNVIRFAARRGS